MRKTINPKEKEVKTVARAFDNWIKQEIKQNCLSDNEKTMLRFSTYNEQGIAFTKLAFLAGYYIGKQTEVKQ
jgi:hypothetical protein